MFFRVRRVGCLGAVASSKTALAMRPQVVAYGFATPAATLCLSTMAHAVFPASAAQDIQKRPMRAPRELTSSLRAPGPFARPAHRRPLQKVGWHLLAPLSRFFSPSALKVQGVHSTRRCLTLRSDRAVSHDLAGLLRLEPSRNLCGWHSWGLLRLEGDSRPPEQPPRCRFGCSLMTLLGRCPPLAGTQPLRRAASSYLPAVPSGLHSVGRPLSLTSGFPFARTRPPHGVFFVGPAVPPPTPRPPHLPAS